MLPWALWLPLATPLQICGQATYFRSYRWRRPHSSLRRASVSVMQSSQRLTVEDPNGGSNVLENKGANTSELARLWAGDTTTWRHPITTLVLLLVWLRTVYVSAAKVRSMLLSGPLEHFPAIVYLFTRPCSWPPAWIAAIGILIAQLAGFQLALIARMGRQTLRSWRRGQRLFWLRRGRARLQALANLEEERRREEVEAEQLQLAAVKEAERGRVAAEAEKARRQKEREDLEELSNVAFWTLLTGASDSERCRRTIGTWFALLMLLRARPALALPAVITACVLLSKPPARVFDRLDPPRLLRRWDYRGRNQGCGSADGARRCGCGRGRARCGGGLTRRLREHRTHAHTRSANRRTRASRVIGGSDDGLNRPRMMVRMMVRLRRLRRSDRTARAPTCTPTRG